MKKLILSVVFLLVLSSSFSLVAVNSNDWKGIYLGIEYAKLKGEDYVIIYSENDVKGIHQSVTLINYKEKVVNAKALLDLMGVKVNQVNAKSLVELESKLFGNEKKLCVVNDGYKALVLSSDYSSCPIVIFDRDHLTEFSKFLNGKEVTLYFENGALEDKLSEEGVNYKVNSKDYLELNLDLLKKFKNSKVFEFVDVAYVDPTILFGNPIIIDEANMSEVAKILNESDVRLVEVIGAQQIPKAYELKNLLKPTSFVVRYGRVEVAPGSARALPLNVVDFGKLIENLKIVEAYYNEKSGHLILKFKNEGSVPELYYTTLSNGVKDEFLHQINPDEYGFVAIETNYLDQVSGSTVYGMNYPLLNFVNDSKWNLNVTKVNFYSPVKVKEVYFNESDYAFYIVVSSEKPTYVDAEIYNFVIDGKNYTFNFDGIKYVNGEAKLRIPVDVSIKVIKENPKIHIAIYSGDTDSVLDLASTSVEEYKLIKGTTLPYLLIGIIILVALVAGGAYLFVKRKRK